MSDETGRAFYKVNEIAQILRVSECTVYRLVSSRRLASIKVGGRTSTTLVRAEDLHQFVERQRSAAVWEG